MLKAYLLHLFNVAGGGERVSLEIANALRSKGFRIIYVTNSTEAMKKVAKLLGLSGDYETIEVNSLLEEVLGSTGRFMRYRRLLLLHKGLAKLYSIEKDIDTLIVDTSTNHPFSVDISYIHYPLTISTTKLNSLYIKLYDWIVKYKARKMQGKPRIVLTNSTWTKRILKEDLNIDAEVVHPPTDVKYFSYDGRKKEKVIVTISRFTPEKNLYLLPLIASRLSDYEWYLVGSMGARGFEVDISKRVLWRILKESEKLKARNFHVVMNIPRDKLRELLMRATFYVHPMFPEHFGIAVAEAISAGCIPIVYRDGGAWTDIVSLISQELGYNKLEDIYSIIRKLEGKYERLDELMFKAVEFSKMFKAEVFREKFIDLLVKHGII